MSMSEILMGLYGIVALYFGWQILNKLQASLGLTFIASSAIYFLLCKAILAVIVGIFTTPFQIIFAIYKAVSSSKSE